MSESNCAAPAEKPSRSSPSITDAPSRTSSGPACTRSPAGSAASSPRGASRTVAVDVHARAPVAHGAVTGSCATTAPPTRASPSGR